MGITPTTLLMLFLSFYECISHVDSVVSFGDHSFDIIQLLGKMFHYLEKEKLLKKHKSKEKCF